MFEQELEVNLEPCRFRGRAVGERSQGRGEMGVMSHRDGEKVSCSAELCLCKSPGTSRRIFVLLALGEGFSCSAPGQRQNARKCQKTALRKLKLSL